jgi:DNA-binding Lrp family transcriptional regulator
MLDDKDRKIVEYFKKNPRSSFNQAAGEINLAKATIKRRFDNLMENDVINVLLTANASKLDFSHALSFIEITQPSAEKAILDTFHACPLVTTMFSLSGFEYNLVICLFSKDRNYITRFMDTFPLSRLDGVKRRNTFFTKETEGFAEKPFWIPLAKDSQKSLFDKPFCNFQCDTCPLINQIEKDFE